MRSYSCAEAEPNPWSLDLAGRSLMQGENAIAAMVVVVGRDSRTAI